MSGFQGAGEGVKRLISLYCLLFLSLDCAGNLLQAGVPPSTAPRDVSGLAGITTNSKASDPRIDAFESTLKIDACSACRINLTRLSTQVRPLDEIYRAYPVFGSRRDRVLKIVIKVS